MLGLKRTVKVGAALAGGSLVLGGCGRNLVQLDDAGGTSGTDDTGSSASATATDPTMTTSPTDPTVSTGDPTGTTGEPLPQPGPPMLIDARFLDNLTVELFFSEPIVPPDAVDPTKFRLSIGVSWGGYYGPYGYTQYLDIGQWNGDEVCQEYCCYNYEYCYDYDGDGDYCYEWCYQQPGPPLKIAQVRGSSGYASRAQLVLDQSIKSQVCEQISDWLDGGYGYSNIGGIFVHYSNNGATAIVDSDESLPLDAIAEHWVVLANQQNLSVQGQFPLMNPFIPIDCPF
jgi:hypothetical protein